MKVQIKNVIEREELFYTLITVPRNSSRRNVTGTKFFVSFLLCNSKLPKRLSLLQSVFYTVSTMAITPSVGVIIIIIIIIILLNFSFLSVSWEIFTYPGIL
jgi:hypothetical protein